MHQRHTFLNQESYPHSGPLRLLQRVCAEQIGHASGAVKPSAVISDPLSIFERAVAGCLPEHMAPLCCHRSNWQVKAGDSTASAARSVLTGSQQKTGWSDGNAFLYCERHSYDSYLTRLHALIF